MSIDYAKAEYLDSWLHHPVIGDPSWDSFKREPGNPIYTGSDPMLWAVNGFLFHDPVSKKWYSYIGLYPRNYWPAGPSLVMREKDGGGWEKIGLAITGDANLFDGKDGKPGCTPDVSIVYDSGKYHMVYDWGQPDDPGNGLGNSRGDAVVPESGIAYAWADKPEGPFHRAPTPIHLRSTQPVMLGRFQRTYAATLLKRKDDWIIFAMTDSCIPGVGAWAMVGMTSKNPEGPYTAPEMLLYPQSDVYHPLIIEFYPAFAHDDFIYVPATSVASNRTYQALFKAPREQAHVPSAWTLERGGSLWHYDAVPCEKRGIWGQTFSGQVTGNGDLRVLFPSKNADDAGTISIAKRKWAQPYRDGFVLSAPNATSHGILCKSYSDFTLEVHLESVGKWALCWNCHGPLGTDRLDSEAKPNAAMKSSRTELRVDGDRWRMVRIDANRKESEVCSGTAPKPQKVRVVHGADRTELGFDDKEIWSGKDKSEAGRIEIVGEPESRLSVSSFIVGGTELEYSESWLPIEAVAGYSAILGEWKAVEDSRFCYRQGYVSTCKEATAKWNVYGAGFKLHLPKGPDYGKCAILLNGQELGRVNLRANEPENSAVVFEHKMPVGYHAIKIRPLEGLVPCDVLEVIR